MGVTFQFWLLLGWRNDTWIRLRIWSPSDPIVCFDNANIITFCGRNFICSQNVGLSTRLYEVGKSIQIFANSSFTVANFPCHIDVKRTANVTVTPYTYCIAARMRTMVSLRNIIIPVIIPIIIILFKVSKCCYNVTWWQNKNLIRHLWLLLLNSSWGFLHIYLG